MIFGMDYLGGVHYQDALINTHPEGRAGGIFLNTFGDARDTIEAMSSSGKFSEIVVHLAPFDYSHQYPIDKYMPSVQKGARAMQRIQKAYPDTKLILSPFCENHHSVKTLKLVFAKIKELAPDCLYLNSGDVSLSGIISEIHLDTSKNLPVKPKGEYTVSFDGFGGSHKGNFTDTDLIKIFKKYLDARHIRGWNFRMNGKYGPDDPATLTERKHWPDEGYLKGHHAMMKTNREPGGTIWTGESLYKPFAEDHGNGGKENMALAILNVDKAELRVFDKNGKQIGRMFRYPGDSISPKGARYYARKYAYRFGNDAQKTSGSRLIRIENMPPIDADLRNNLFK